MNDKLRASIVLAYILPLFALGSAAASKLPGAGWWGAGFTWAWDAVRARFSRLGKGVTQAQALAFTRATVAYAPGAGTSWTQYAVNVIRQIAAGVWVEKSVTNRLINSGNLMLTGWGPSGTATREATTIPAPAFGFWTRFYRVSEIDTVVQSANVLATPGEPLVGSVWLMGEGANIGKKVRLVIKRGSGGTFVSQDVTLVLTAEPQRVYVSFVPLSDTVNAALAISVTAVAGDRPTSFLAACGQIESGTFPTSPIETGATKSSRMGDALALNLPGAGNLEIEYADVLRPEISERYPLGSLNLLSHKAVSALHAVQRRFWKSEIIRFEVRPGDVTFFDTPEKERAESLTGTSYAKGVSVWNSKRFRIGSGFTTSIDPGSWFIVGQWHGFSDVDGRSPYIAIKVEGNDLTIDYRYHEPGGDGQSSSFVVYRWVDFPRDTWIDLVMEHNVAETDGYFRVWVNGVQVVNYTGPLGYWDHASGGYWKDGIYRKAANFIGVTEVACWEEGLTSLAARIASPLPIETGKQTIEAIPDGAGVYRLEPALLRLPVVKSIKHKPSSATSLAMPETVASVVAFGDSITFGQNATTDANRWTNIVAASLGATLLNQGIAGTVLQNSNDAGGGAKVNNGRDRYVSALTGANKKAMAIIAYGFNDARYIGAPGTFNRAAFEADYREVIDGLIAGGYGRGDIVLVSPHYITDTGLLTGSTGFLGQTREEFEAHVAVVRKLATEYGVYYADSYSAMRDGGGASLIDTDFIHPKNNGHVVIAAAVMAARRTPVAVPPDVTAPTITSTASPSVAENVAFSLTLTANEGVAWTKTGGADAALFTLTGDVLTMAAKDFEAPVDGGANNTYIVQVTATDAALNATSQTIAVTVTDAAEGGGAFLSDTMTGTNGTALTAHSPETGGAWSAQSGYTPSPENTIQANRMLAGSGVGVYRNAAVPASADYYVECVLDWVSTLTADNIGVTGRASAAANTFYFARWSQSAGGFQLFKCVAGTNTQLGTTYVAAFASGSRAIRLTMTGSTIAMSVDGVERVSVTDTAITAAGFAGVRAGLATSASTGIHLTSIVAQ